MSNSNVEAMAEKVREKLDLVTRAKAEAGQLHIRPVQGQGLSTRLHVECSKELSDLKRHPLGTRFRIRAKLTDRRGGGAFLYSYFGWSVEVAREPRKNWGFDYQRKSAWNVGGRRNPDLSYSRAILGQTWCRPEA